MQNLVLPTSSNLFGNYKLKPIKMLGTVAKITDYAMINGRFYWPDETSIANYGLYLFDQRKNKGMDEVSYIDSDGKPSSLIYSDGLGIRPVADFSLLKDNIELNRKKRRNGVVEIEYGYCLQDAVSKKMQDELNNVITIDDLVINSKQRKNIKNILQVDNLLKTDGEYFNNIKIFKELSHDNIPVYKYKDRRFANVTVRNHNVMNDCFRLSNGKTYQKGEKVWIEEKPVKWLLDEEQNLMISEKILQTDIKIGRSSSSSNFYCDELNLYLGWGFMIKDRPSGEKELVKKR